MQLSDYAIGTRSTPHRLVPGDGDIPLARIVHQLLDAGYAGVFDIEIVGPAIDDEGYERAIERSIAAVQDLLGDGEASGQEPAPPNDPSAAT